MRTARGETDQLVANSHFSTVNQFRFLCNTDTEPGQIVVFAFVHAWHLSGLAADQGTSGEFTAIGNTVNYGGSCVYLKLAGGVVVEEEKWLGTTDNKVVDAHGDQIYTDTVMFVVIQCEAQLCAYPVGSGNQYWLSVASG